MYTTTSPSRELSVLSDDLDSCFNYSRSLTSPTRYSRSVDKFIVAEIHSPEVLLVEKYRTDMRISSLLAERQQQHSILVTLKFHYF
jgi:hypothetical protein